MRASKRRSVGVAAGAALLLAGLAFYGVWALRPRGDRAEYPADPADQPPAVAAFDTSTLTVPGCPLEQPEEAPVAPGKPGEDKLVDWGAVRFVRCTYFGPTTYELQNIDAIDDLRAVTDAVRVLRRMLTAAQFTEYFGISTMEGPVPAMAVPSYRYLFQFPDGHVTEVDLRGGYYRDSIRRFRWSVRGTSVAPLAIPGSRTCAVQGSRTCRITGTMATLAD